MLMTLNYIFVVITCFLYSMLFSAILMLFRPTLYHLQPLTDTILFQLYRGFIVPMVNYCAWHCVAPPTALLSKSIEWIHARFVSHMSNDVGFVKVALAECHHFHAIVQVYRILHQLILAYLQVCLCFLRCYMYVYIPRMRTTYVQKSLSYRYRALLKSSYFIWCSFPLKLKDPLFWLQAFHRNNYAQELYNCEKIHIYILIL